MKGNTCYLDHSFLYTDDDIFFCVGGNLHSKDSVFGMPWYFSTRTLEEIMGIQINEFCLIGGKKYTKLLSQISRDSYPDFIKDYFPDYYYSPPMWEILMKVDRSKIVKVIDPRQRVNQIMGKVGEKEIEKNPLLYTLQQISRYDPSLFANMGISGSALLSDDFLAVRNDLDLVFYGKSRVNAVKDFSNTITRLNPRFTKLEGEYLDRYLKQKAKDLGGSEDSLRNLVRGRWDILYVDGIKLDFSFVDGFVLPPFGSYNNFHSRQQVAIKTKITDISDSFFLPTVIGIESIEPEKVVITKRGYICLFKSNQVVEITGMKYDIAETGTCVILIDDFNGGTITLV